MSDFLERVVAERRGDVAAAKRRGPPDLARPPRRPPHVLRSALRAARARGRVAVIAEVKRVSPALGALVDVAGPLEGAGAARGAEDVALRARRYAEAGATAISVLTEPRHWGGSLDDLRRVRAAVRLPVLCKDVIVDASQITEACEAGADAVLLIAEALGDHELRALLAHAGALGMDALVEAHEPAAFGRAVASGAEIVGVNARDLRHPEVIDRSRARLLHTFVRQDQVFVAESGIASASDICELPARVDAVLVGTALMRQRDPAALVRELAGVRSRDEWRR